MAKIFISYAREDYRTAEAISLVLKEDGHKVFLDTDKLRAGSGYHTKIRDELKSSNLIIFLMSRHFFEPGRYTLSELRFTKEFFPEPSEKVLPVKLSTLERDEVDPYLAYLNWFVPLGSIEAEVAVEVNRLLPAVAEQRTGAKEPGEPTPRSQFIMSLLAEVVLLFLRSITGMVVGLVAFVMFLISFGFLIPLGLAIVFSIVAGFIGSSSGKGAFIGLLLGTLGLICGFSAWGAAGFAGRRSYASHETGLGID